MVVSSGVLTHQFEDKDGGNTLFQWVVLKKHSKEILHHLHDGPLGAHLGENKTLEKRERFRWPEHAADVKEWCSSWKLCCQRKMPNPKPKAPLVSVQAGYPMQVVGTDIVGPLPESSSGNSYILAAADCFTQWVKGYPTLCQEAVVDERKLVHEMFCHFLPPE